MIRRIGGWFIFTTAALLISSCISTSPTPTSSNPTPLADEQAASSSPEIEITITPLGKTTPTPAGQVQEYAPYGFRFALPLGLRMVEQPAGGDLRLSLGITREGDEAAEYLASYPRAPIGLRVFEKPESTGLLEWFNGKQESCYDSREKSWRWDVFIDPFLVDQEAFKGNPALRWDSGCFPVPSEIVVDRRRWVITLDDLQDYPEDYEVDYQQILASLEFFEPESGEGVALIAPTPTPTVCLDEAAQSIQLPPRQNPLEVRFISDGDIWVWEEGDAQAQLVLDNGKAEFFSFSPDGEQVAFLSGDQTQLKLELWAIQRDGSNLRRLVSPDQVRALAGEPPNTDIPYIDGINWQLEWLEGAKRVGFEILRSLEGIGGCCESRGRWQVDLESGEVEPWSPPESPRGPAGVVSPDGRLVAITDDDSLSIASTDGTILHADALTFQPFSANLEGPGYYGPTVAWSDDSQSLFASTLLEDIFSERAGTGVNFAVWQLPADGGAPRQMWTFSAVPFSIRISPNQEFLAYLKGTQAGLNHRELHLARIDGSKDVVYTQGHTLEFWGWAPDGVHFIFAQYSIRAPQWGYVCGGSQPLLDPPVMPVSSLTWVDAERFLFVTNDELRLGQVGGGSLPIGPFSDEYASYQFNREEAALGDSK